MSEKNHWLLIPLILQGHHVLWVCMLVSVFVAKLPLSVNWAQSLSGPQRGPWLQQPIWGPRHAARQPAAWLFGINWLSPACRMALVHKARPGICADTYLVGGDPSFVCQQHGVKWMCAAAGHAVLCWPWRSRWASGSRPLLACRMITSQMLVTPELH